MSVLRLILVFFWSFALIAKPGDEFFAHNQLYISSEYGFVGFINHSIQFDESVSRINYVKDVNQKILFPSWRIKAGFKFLKKHRLEFLYQPIFITTKFSPNSDLNIDNISFTQNMPVEAVYNFPFYRLGYTYNMLNSQQASFLLGAGLQIRNATISFASINGEKLFETQSLGPVPLIILGFDYYFDNSFYISSDASGFWAPIRYINGGSTDIEGWIYEAALEGGLEVSKWMDGFANIRLLGGGNRGSSSQARKSGGKFSENILNTLSFTIGFRFKTKNFDS